MCLAVPGKIISVTKSEQTPSSPYLGIVDFQGTRVEVSLQMTPEAKQGDWVLIHAGFALQILDEKEAREIWGYLKEAEVGGEVPEEFKDEPPK